MDNIITIVLAAGGGKRMEPLKSGKPKVMLPILGRPVLEHVLENIKQTGIKKVTIVVLEKTADQITRYFKNEWNGLDINYVFIKETLGPAYALNEAKDKIKTSYFLVQYGDSLADKNIPQKLLEVFKKDSDVDGVLALREVDDPTRYGVVLYENNKIVSVIDNPGSNKSKSNHAVMGTFILKTSMFKKSIENQKFTIDKQLFPAQYMLKDGARLSSYFFQGKRVDVGKPEDLFNASMLLSDKPIKCIAFDADNTLYNTHETSKIADIEAMKILAEKTGEKNESLYNEWLEIVEDVKDSKVPQKRSRKYSYNLLLKKHQKTSLINNMYETFKKSLLKNIQPIGGNREILSSLPQRKVVITEDSENLTEDKLKATKLDKFFDQIITPQKTGTMKPSEKFYISIYKNFEPEEVLIVGDDYKKDLEIPSKIGSRILFVENEQSLEKLKLINKGQIKRIHIMGAAGAGAAAIAGISKAYGYEVTACDLNPKSAYTQNLKIKIVKGHSGSHLKDIDLLVISPAVEKLNAKNPELIKAKNLNIPTISWQEFQGEYLQKDKFVITVAGAYGKSTTTSMIAKILIEAGLDPTCEIGAKVLEWKNNFRIGKSKYYVCESDEYNNNFLNYNPDIAVVLNVDWDHPDFFKTKDSVLNSYKMFVSNIKPGGILVIPKSLNDLKKIRKDIKIVEFKDFGKFNLSIIGDFRKENANAAVTVADALNINPQKAKKSVEDFKGTGRRLEYKGKIQNIKFYDDYAVQPYTVKTTTNALKKKYKNQKVCLVFEPHTFSRIKTFFDDFEIALKNSGADQILITEIYPAREKGDKEALARELAKRVGPKAKYTGSLQETADALMKNLKSFDVILSMGAGDSYKLYELLS